MNIDDENNQAAQEQPTKSLTTLQRIIGIFSSPQSTFADAIARPNWVFPFILLILITSLSAQLMVPAIIADYRSSERFEKMYDGMVEKGQITQEQADRFKETGYKNVQNFAAAGAGFSIALVSFITAAVLLFVGNIIFSGKAKYAQLLGIYCWGGLVALLGVLVRVPLSLAKMSTKVYFSPAAFFPDSAEKTALFRIAAALDVFTIWRVILLAIGFAALYRFTMGKSLAIIGTMYAIMVAVSLLIPGFF
ncbi:MAG: YIP1 family protein [bacterium]|nr:YIP1 family protein [bacterium]